jgi:hypothetical protein
MNEKLEGWVTEHGGVRFCPVCRAKVEKNEGCNHMTCIICKYEFCWFCLGYAGHDARHFDPLNPYSCGAGQFDRTATRWPIINYLKFIVGFLLMVVLAPILYVCFFVFGGLFSGAVVSMEILRTKNCLVGLFGACFGLIGGVLVGALLAPFAALIYLVSILYAFFVGLKLLCLNLLIKIRSFSGVPSERFEER